MISKSGGLGFDSIVDVINSSDDISDVTKMFKQMDISKSAAEYALNASKYADATDDIIDAVSELSGASSGVNGISNAFRGLGTTIKNAILSPIGLATIAIASFTGIMKLADAAIVTFDEKIEKSAQSTLDYDNAASEVNELKSELEQVDSEIASIQAKGVLTLADQNELSKLQAQRQELEAMLNAKEKLAEKAQQEAASDASDVLVSTDDNPFYNVKSDKNYQQKTDVTLFENMDNALARADEFKKKAQDIQDILNSGYEDGEKISDGRRSSLEGRLETYKSWIEESEDIIENSYNKILTEREDLVDDQTGIAIKGYENLVSQIDSYTKKYDEYFGNITDKQVQALSDIWKDDSFAQAQQKLVDSLRSGNDLSIEDITNQFPELVAACDDAGISVETLHNELLALAQSDTGLTELEDQFTQFQLQAVSAINSLDTINAALVDSFSGKGLGIEYDAEAEEYTGDLINIANAYKNLEGYDASVLFEKTANGVHLNREALRALQAQQESIQKQNFLEQQISLQKQYNDSVKSLEGLEVGSDEYNATQINIDSLSSQLELVNQLSAAYDGATSAYQKWMDAQSNGEDGDMYRSVSETMRERGKEIYESGRYNTEEFRAIAQFYSNQDLSAASMEQVVKAYQNSVDAINRYFTGDKQGIDNLIYDIQQKVPDAIQEVEDESGEVKLKFNLDDESVADALGISHEALQTILRGASEYTDSIVLGSTSNIDDIESKLSEMSQKAEEAKTKLRDLQSSGELSTTIDFDIDTSKLDEAGLEDRIEELTNLKEEVSVKFGADSSEVEYVNQLLEEAELRKQILEQQSAVSISVDITGEGDIDTLYQKLASLPEDETSNVSINITDASQLDSVVNQIEQIPEDNSVNFSFTVQNEEEADSLKSKLDELESSSGKSITYTINTIDNTGDTLDDSSATKTVTVNEVRGTTVDVSDETKTVTVNYTKGSQESPENKNAKVNYDKGSQENPENKNAIVDYNRGKQDAPLSPRTAVVNYTLGTVEKPSPVTVKVNYDTSGAPSGSGPANGTAHFHGTAFAQGTTSGDWSLRQNEPNALINELGSEIVVRDGKWFVLNNGYPTFANLRKGDVVFNHAQSESLLKNGYVTGSHAHLAYENSFVNGSAFSSGSWVFGNTGSGNLQGTGAIYTGGATYSTQKAAEATQQAAESVSEAADEFEEAFDEIEILLDRMDRSLQKLTNSIETYSYDLYKQSSVSDQAMNQIRNNLTTLQQAYNRYIQEANSVRLDESWASKVRDGSINVETITDESLMDKIKDYQNWCISRQCKIFLMLGTPKSLIYHSVVMKYGQT